MAVFYIQSTSPSLSQDDYIILVIWVLNIFMLFLRCNMFILHHLARQCPPRTTEWGWVCPWSNWAPQMLPSFSHSCWSGSLPERSVTIRRKNCNDKRIWPSYLGAEGGAGDLLNVKPEPVDILVRLQTFHRVLVLCLRVQEVWLGKNWISLHVRLSKRIKMWLSRF